MQLGSPWQGLVWPLLLFGLAGLGFLPVPAGFWIKSRSVSLSQSYILLQPLSSKHPTRAGRVTIGRQGGGSRPFCWHLCTFVDVLMALSSCGACLCWVWKRPRRLRGLDSRLLLASVDRVMPAQPIAPGRGSSAKHLFMDA